MVPGAKSGPLSQADIQAIWEGAVDPSYSQPFEAAGEGNGFEAWTQMFAQFARASQAVDVSTQALYILPGSGQSNPSAQGANLATVRLTMARTGYMPWALVLAPGQFFVDELASDWGTLPGQDGVQVLTGRRYTPVAPLVFPPGDGGPYTVAFQAEAAGYGYNNPQPGTITQPDQQGSGYAADRATVRATTAFPTPPLLTGPSIAEAISSYAQVPEFLPQHVGQYVQLTAGANAGAVVRATGFVAGSPSAGTGLLLGVDYAFELTAPSAAYAQGETVNFKSGATLVAVGQVLGETTLPGGHARLVVQMTRLSTTAPAVGQTVTGVQSGATATIAAMLQAVLLTNEAPPSPAPPGTGASWRVLDWVADWGVTATNAAQPSGGTSAMLDALGAERNIFRGGGEPDSSYSQHVAQAPDTVTPNAIKRAANWQLGTLGAACLREVGQPALPGFFYDRPRTDAGGDFWDTDCLLFTLPFPVLFPPYQRNERIAWVDAQGHFVADGWFGGLLTSTSLLMIRKRGPARLVAQAGDLIVSENFGASPTQLAVVSVVQPACATAQRFHVWVDYTDMRAFFLLGVPNISQGDFGFAYDGDGTVPYTVPASPGLQHKGGFYDRGYGANFYDGFPVLARQVWGQVWRVVEKARAGGVTWTMYRETIGCP